MESNLSSNIGVIVRLIGAVVGFIYAAGFLVVSIYLAAYGVVPVGLFRAKFMAAGTAFLVFVALALLPAIRLRSSDDEGNTAGPSRSVPKWKTKLVSGAISVSLLYTYSYTLAFLTTGFYLSRVEFDRRGLIVLAAFVAAVGAITYAQTFWGLAWRSAVLSLICGALLERVSMAYTSQGFQSRVIWFALVGVLAHQLPRQLPSIRRFEGLSPELLFLLGVGLASIFAHLVYPRIRPEYGGGLPSPAVIKFDGYSPLGKADRSRVWLLDETDDGYYILPNKGSTKAVYVPRKAVGAIYFGEATGDGQ
jgi:hypothetical protein